MEEHALHLLASIFGLLFGRWLFENVSRWNTRRKARLGVMPDSWWGPYRAAPDFCPRCGQEIKSNGRIS